MPAGAAADPCETSGEDATADVAVELALHQLRHHLASMCDGGGEGRAVMTNRTMQWDVFDVTREVARRQRRAGVGLGSRRSQRRARTCSSTPAVKLAEDAHGDVLAQA
jgi:hypothetical protein